MSKQELTPSIKIILEKDENEVTIEEFIQLCDFLRNNTDLVARVKDLGDRINDKPAIDTAYGIGDSIDDENSEDNFEEGITDENLICCMLVSGEYTGTPLYLTVLTNYNDDDVADELRFDAKKLEILKEHGIEVSGDPDNESESPVMLDLGPFILGEWILPDVPECTHPASASIH
jgi:hypothetical protein